MLTEFFEFLREHKDYRWVHWNMRDINYGFEALENRLVVLGGAPYHLQDENKFDLARLMIDKYAVKYIKHPRLINLVKRNNISDNGMLTGADEADPSIKESL
jgi:hypothetical protein